MGNIYQQRRETLMEQIGAGSAIFRSAPLAVMHNDVEYNFRQDSDFFYLTGFDEPEAVAVLAPHHEEHRFVLFVQPKDPLKETWTGYRVGVEAAQERFGADMVYPIEELDEHLPQYLEQADRIYYCLNRDRTFNDTVIQHWQALMAGFQKQGHAPMALENPGPLLHAQRLVKSDAELVHLRKAVAIAVEAHLAALEMSEPGLYEYEIQAEMERIFRLRGGTGPAYPSIVASGSNACILHYTANNEQIHEQDLLLIDAGCCFNYYNSDITRTFPVNGKFTKPQQALYELVLAAQTTAIASAQPGESFNGVHEAAVSVLTQGLVDLGLLHGDVETLIEEETYKPFYMHRTSHWLGLDVHDAGSYKLNADEWRSLQPGHVLTVEPGLYIGPHIELAEDQPPVPEEWRGIGIRIEDDVLITESGPEVLTQAVPKKLEDLTQL